ncbi:hypothetical protein NPIL_73241 [Nephila pilipes]|uniref:Uncharacterized protein n=1 Tax=Nephila pilipes TaxID=299642 RepID=A0A8X6PU15_NEPPI|nr:hypothetical protein NPIL_73241 [Nephila pilipes]
MFLNMHLTLWMVSPGFVMELRLSRPLEPPRSGFLVFGYLEASPRWSVVPCGSSVVSLAVLPSRFCLAVASGSSP